jgi:ribonucleoside-diphosphate reductase alpha subunit
MLSNNNVEREMFVIKRNGQRKVVEFDKILRRIKVLGTQAGLTMNYTSLTMKVIDQLFDGISTTQIDELSAEQCASLSSIHPDYNTLAGHIVISNHQKNSDSAFTEVVSKLYKFIDKNGIHSPLICEKLYQLTLTHGNLLNDMCVHSRDYLIDYFGFKTLERAYLMKIDGKVIERPQHLWLRTACGIHGDDIASIRQTYDLMSQKYFTHATPTLFNAGTPNPQLSSCFLQAMESDSIEGIYNTLKDCALISKWAGGIGLHIHNVRASGSHIRGTNGSSNGIVPMLRVFNNTARYVDQCLDKETIIYTTDGPKQIQECSSQETTIFNLNGDTETIQQVLEHDYDGPLLDIQTTHSLFNMKVTPQHPIYVLREQQRGVDHSLIRNRIDKGLVQCLWIDAGELTTNDMVVYSIPKHDKDCSTISSDDCYMYGILLGDDSFDTNNFSVCTDNKSHIGEWVKQYLDSKYVSYKITVDNTTTRILWNHSTMLPFTQSDFYDKQKQKHISSKWLNLPLIKSKFILKGLVNIHDCNSNIEISFNATSLNLLESVRFICLKMGSLTSGFISNENNMRQHCLFIPKTEDICSLLNIEYHDTTLFTFFKHNNLLFSRIENITQTHYKGLLYDLQMKDQHNYLIHNGLVHNGGGRRNGSFAIYLEPWHADIEMFLQMRKNTGDEELKARDLFYAIWVPDLFMERIKADGDWTLMCPDECPGLADVYGEKFKALYTKYEIEGKGRKTVKARDIWYQVLDAQMETGTPYILYKDACNEKSNQKNVGTIKSSNLCTEIIEYSDKDETAVCNLASIALPTFMTNGIMDYNKLHNVTKVVTHNLNRVIDVNYYPTEKTRKSNMRHRPVGIGVQGLADVFMMMNIAFDSVEAAKVNRDIFETIYHGAIEKSCELAVLEGKYETFDGSPASNGILQFDMWNINPGNERYDWDSLKKTVMTNGLRNSLLLAPMPTASTSQILGYNECIEPFTSNIYNRRTLAGEFMLTNKYLVKDLLDLGIWNEQIKNNIIANNGSVQHIEGLSVDIKNKYKTVWEISMKKLIDMSADRGAFICQSQSLNLWLEDPNYNSLTSMHFYSWSKGLKTGIYYMRRKARHQAQQFTIEPTKRPDTIVQSEGCEMCGS